MSNAGNCMEWAKATLRVLQKRPGEEFVFAVFEGGFISEPEAFRMVIRFEDGKFVVTEFALDASGEVFLNDEHSLDEDLARACVYLTILDGGPSLSVSA